MSKHIVACIDDSASAVAVCEWTAWASLKLKVPSTLLHVLDRDEYPSRTDLSGSIGLGAHENLLEQLTQLDEQRGKLALEQGRHLLAAAKTRVESAGAQDVGIRQRHANLLETLAELEKDIRLLIMGRQGKTSESSMAQIGSQLESTIRALHCPILVSLPQFKAPQQIMVAYDGSPTSQKIIQTIIQNSALLQDIKCHLVMVGTEPKTVLQDVQSMLSSLGFEVTAALRTGELDQALINYAKENSIDLIVMGAYGHSAIRRFILGSNTSRMLQQTQVPLLLLR